MKLAVKNLGAVSHAEVDLSKDLLIFTGENNSGKTYLAYTVHAVFDPETTSDGQFSLNKYFSVENGFFSKTELFLQTDKTDSNQEGILNVLLSTASVINEITLKSLHNKTVIFPSVREGINLFNKELSVIKNKTFDTLLSRSEAQNLSQFLSSRFNKYPKAIRNSLSMAQNLDAQRVQTSAYTHLADELENLFLQGKISVNTEGDVLFKPFNSKQSLDIHMTSSTIKSLSLLTIYLRHIAQKNDFIIIDEPELNLHPDNQRKIARFIARLVNEGFKVLISTHSDYIVRELNNLIMLDSGLKSKPDETTELLKTYAYNTNELLDKDRVGVYLFRVGQPVLEVPIEETGFNVATIDEEARKLNQSSQDIYFTLFD